MYSRRHQTLNPDTDREFWDFGFEQLAIDHVANIEQILEVTGHERLSLFVYSVGGATAIASAAIYPDFYEQRTDVLIAMAPAMSFRHTPSFAYVMIIDNPEIFNIFRMLGIYEIAGVNTFSSSISDVT